jgi:uncharacterized protein YjbJ (UPF0337 family)
MFKGLINCTFECGNDSIITKRHAMKSNLELKGDWNTLKGKLKQQFAELTDNDVLLVEGKEDELLGRLQKKLGKTKAEILKQISEL